MRRLKKITFVLIIIFAAANIVSGQSSATATASATIVTPLELTIHSAHDAEFTEVSITSSTAIRPIVVKDFKEISKGRETISIVQFAVDSKEPFTYNITSPHSITLTHTSGEQIRLNTALVVSTRTKLFLASPETFHLIADLYSRDLKLQGLYTSQNIPITIDHN